MPENPRTHTAPDADPVVQGVAAWLSDTSILSVTGRDAGRFLNAVLTQDLAPLRTNEGRYAALVDDRGRPVSDLCVYLTIGGWILEVPRACASRVVTALEGWIVADDVTVQDAGAGQVLLALEAADSGRLDAVLPALGLEGLERDWLEAEGPAVGLCPVLGADAGGGDSRTALRASRLGGYGVATAMPRARAEAALESARVLGATTLDAGILTRLEIEAGRPGAAELSQAQILSELGLDGAVSFSKGCFPGQEILNRVRTRGQLQRRLVGVTLEDAAGESWAGGELVAPQSGIVGALTSACWSPTLGRTVGFAFVRRGHWAPGTALEATRPGAAGAVRTRARVETLPFLRRRPPGAPPAEFLPQFRPEEGR